MKIPCIFKLIFAKLIIFSKPLPIDLIKKICGKIPINVAQKKLNVFTLNIQGNTFAIAKGIPPINL